jgi:hypothetical protein
VVLQTTTTTLGKARRGLILGALKYFSSQIVVREANIMVWFSLCTSNLERWNPQLECIMCPVYVSSQVDGGGGRQKQQASHNRLAISCHLQTMQTVLELVPLSTQPNNKGDDDHEQVPKNSSQDVQQPSKQTNKQTYHQFIYIHTHT